MFPRETYRTVTGFRGQPDFPKSSFVTDWAIVSVPRKVVSTFLDIFVRTGDFQEFHSVFNSVLSSFLNGSQCVVKGVSTPSRNFRGVRVP